MKVPFYITAAELVSSVGIGIGAHVDSLSCDRSSLRLNEGFAQGLLPSDISSKIRDLREEKLLRHQDKTTLLAVLLARSIQSRACPLEETGVLFSSSRGPTSSLESSWKAFQTGARLPAHTSPVTTSSAIPAAVARDLGLRGPISFLSAACSSSLLSIIHACGLISLGLTSSMLAGGVEAANTPFTLAMLQSAQVLDQKSPDSRFLCRPMAENRGGMVLSEGGGAILIESQRRNSSIAEIVGWGSSTEHSTLTGVSEDGFALKTAILSALERAELSSNDIDLIVGHGAGTLKGDKAERSAYKELFGEEVPLVFHKWMFGHMLGGSAIASAILGAEHLRQGSAPGHPYLSQSDVLHSPRILKQSRFAMICSLGFGGIAAVIIVKKIL